MARLARLRSQLDRRHPREIIDPRQTHRPLARGGLLVLTLSVSLPAMIGCGSSGKGGHSSGLVAIGAGLKGPSGLTATVYGKGPATVAALTFDPQGRLWLAAAGLEAHAQDGVYLLAKPGGRAVRIIAGLSDPLGLDWHAGSLYVSSIGRVDAFGGFNGRRFTQHTTVLRGPVPGGENNVLVMTPDGRFVMGVTASCDHCVPRSPFSGSIVSFRPDGGDLRLFARRIRAPVGLAYLPGTSNLLVSMNQRDDLGAATPGDWLAAVAEGQDWGFPGCYGQGGTTCAGVPAPIAVLDKHAAVGALAIMTGQLPGFTGTSAIVPEWQSGKVQRVPLRRAGSTYTGSVEPFLTGVQNPMGITFDPDRSLLVGDWATGTIYSIAARGNAP
jgi:sugar lactone lactonase YvrE